MSDLSLDPGTTALVIIDLQRGVAAMNVAPHPAAEIIANTVRIAGPLKAAGGLVVPVRVAFSAGGVDRLSQPVDAPMQLPPGGMPANWSELVPEIAALPADFVITKRQWSAFHGTELDLQLRRRGVETIILTGIATGFGVESTAREGWQHNYAVVFAEDAMAAPTVEHHTFAVEKIFPRLGRTRSTAAIVAALSR
jgi:nicotinamidase-related amidase